MHYIRNFSSKRRSANSNFANLSRCHVEAEIFLVLLGPNCNLFGGFMYRRSLGHDHGIGRHGPMTPAEMISVCGMMTAGGRITTASVYGVECDCRARRP